MPFATRDDDEVTVRQLGQADLQAYRAIRLEGLERHPDMFRGAYEDEFALPIGTFADRLRNSYTLGVLLGDTLSGIGSVAALPGEKLKHKALLYGMYVRREAAGRGLGESLVRALTAHAAQIFDSVQLTVLSGNARARGLYERCGFVWYGTEPRSVRQQDGFVGEDLLWLRFV